MIYAVSEDKFYTLREAYENKLKGIEDVFNECGLGTLLGDVDRDGKLSVRDATLIQKCIAGIENFDINDEVYGTLEHGGERISYISDYNRDGERNVKDATAIQKRIAGLL